MAARAQEQGQRQLTFGTTLFGTGADLAGQYQRGLLGSLAPFQGYLGTVGDIEALGRQPLEIGASLGGGSAAASQALLSGGIAAADLRTRAAQLNPTASFLQGLGTNQQLTSALGQQAQSLFSRNAPAYNQTQMRSEVVPEGFATNYFTPNPNARFQGYGYY